MLLHELCWIVYGVALMLLIQGNAVLRLGRAKDDVPMVWSTRFQWLRRMVPIVKSAWRFGNGTMILALIIGSV